MFDSQHTQAVTAQTKMTRSNQRPTVVNVESERSKEMTLYSFLAPVKDHPVSNFQACFTPDFELQLIYN